MLTLTRTDLKTVFFGGDSDSIKVVRNSLRIFSPNAHFSQLFRDKKWDGYHKYYNTNDSFNWGLMDIVIPVLKKEKIKYKFIEEYKKPIVSKRELNPILYLHQQQAVRVFLEEKFGIIKVPTRGGKTFIAAQIIDILRIDPSTVFLFVVDTDDLFKSTIRELAKFMNISENEIGQIRGPKFDIKQINVGMIQSLTRVKKSKDVNKKKKFFELLKIVKVLIIDECHEYSSKERVSFIFSFKNIEYQLALSATPYKDSLDHRFEVLKVFGREIYEIAIEDLVERGVLSDDKAFLIAYENRTKKISENKKLGIEKESYVDYQKRSIHENEERNFILSQIIRICKRNRLKLLVLFNSKHHGKILSNLTGEVFISGDDSSEIRDLEKANFLSGIDGVLMASNIYKKGTTLPEAKVVLLADGGQESSSILQKRGRVLGTAENKSRALTIDLLDIGTEYFSDHGLNRLEMYDEVFGKKKIEIYESDELAELEESMKNWFK